MLNIIARKARTFIFYRTAIGEYLTSLYDINHHLKYSFSERKLGTKKEHLKYYLTKHYHIIEKGLALPHPRPGFGQPKIINLLNKTKQYESLYGTDQLTLSIRKTLTAYINFNQKVNYQLPNKLEVNIIQFINSSIENPDYSISTGGLKKIHKELSTKIDLEQYRDFSCTRVSVRDFSDEEVSDSTIQSIINIAQSTPSVCNRQAWMAHYYSDKTEIRKILSYQNGNTGFTDTINKLIIITADIRGFTSFEMKQPYIDGGLFSMNILLAIHAAGLGACPLNTCYPLYLERKVKKISGIADNEKLIMMIAVGKLKDSFEVAFSTRNPLQEVLINHSQTTKG